MSPDESRPAEEKKPSPVTLRIEGDNRKLLTDLLEPGKTTTSVLLEGLQSLAEARRRRDAMPIYPRSVEDEDIAATIDEATSAAVEVLDQLFAGKPAELMGISSNFHGGLREHIEAMLTGRQRSRRTTSLELKPLFADWDSFGKIRSAGPNEGYTMMKLSTRVESPPQFFDSDRNGFVDLKRMDAGCLFTSSEAAVKEAMAWMRKREMSPREEPMKLCLLSWEGEGPLTLAATAT